MLRINDTIEIPDDELVETFVRASGPGGQNVNKVSTAVQLRFDVRNSTALTAAVKVRLEKIAGSRASNDGVIVITANRLRTQSQNREDARARLSEMIEKALVVPKVRRPTRTPYGSKMKRIETKKHRGEIKAGRRARGGDE